MPSILIDGYDDGFDRTGSVGSFEINEYGLYDMGGNVREWCEDWASSNQEKRVLRGASWSGRGENGLHSSRRRYAPPTHDNDNIGFRVVLAAGTGGI